MISLSGGGGKGEIAESLMKRETPGNMWTFLADVLSFRSDELLVKDSSRKRHLYTRCVFAVVMVLVKKHPTNADKNLGRSGEVQERRWKGFPWLRGSGGG
jgi:hypothetical protein